MTEKSTYNAKAQKKYNEKRKQIACTVFIDEYNIICNRAKEKGLTISGYIKHLINNDLEK